MTKLKKLRNRVFEICYKYNNGHLASSLSCLEIINNIYKKFNWRNDVFILSKGHACPAHYSVLEQYGFKFSNKILKQRHPDINPNLGLTITSGSLGHGLPLAVGISLSKILQRKKGIIHVLLGDMENQEGTTWESLCLIRKFNLNNIIIHVDNNENFYCLNNSNGKYYRTKKEFPHSYKLTKEEYEKNIR